MATGISNQLTRQIGEHLVVSMLGREGVIATTFAGSVPEFDIMASDTLGMLHPIQVKTIKSDTWQLDASKFLDISFDNVAKTQKFSIKHEGCNKNIIFVLIKLADTDDTLDTFFVLNMDELQKLILEDYKGIKRPKNWKSTHFALSIKQLKGYQGWKGVNKYISCKID
jgi:hypothetical protein